MHSYTYEQRGVGLSDLVDTLRLGAIESQKGIHMPRIRSPYPPEFRAEAIKLARSSEKSIAEISCELEISS